MISSLIVDAPLEALKTALAGVAAASYEASVDGRHIVVIEAASTDEMIAAYRALERLSCVRGCELIFTECEAPEFGGFGEAGGGEAGADGAGGCVDIDATNGYYPAKLLKGL